MLSTAFLGVAIATPGNIAYCTNLFFAADILGVGGTGIKGREAMAGDLV